MNIISIILARKNSKGIPNKNMINFCGKPLLYYSIFNSLESKYIKDTWVSSDSEIILKYAKNLGANIIHRPDFLCTDTSSSESGWIHALTLIKPLPDLIIGIQATSPLCISNDIDNAIEYYIKNKYDSLFSASLAEDTHIWDGGKSITYNYKNRKRRQEYNNLVIENGAFYIFTPINLISYNNRLHGNIGYYLMAKWQKYQIDDPIDIKICETIYYHKINKND